MLKPDRRVTTSTRARLVKSATREIHRHGYQAFSLDEVWRETGVTKGALYHYFDGKLDLGYAVIDEEVGPVIRDRWLPPLDKVDDPIAAMIAVLEGFNHAPARLVALGCPLNNLSQEMAPLDEGFRARIQRVYLDWQRGIARALERGQILGLVRREIDPADTALFIVATVEGCFGVAKSARSPAVLRSALRSLVRYLESLRPSNLRPKKNRAH